MNRIFTVCLLGPALLASVVIPVAPQEKQGVPDRDDKVEIPIDDENAVARRDFMRTKLLYSQNIFEGLTTGNFKLIKDGIREVDNITAAQQWVEIDDDRYRKMTEDFKTTTRRLAEAAESGNIDATALRYYQMSTSCIDCHKHIRKVGYEL